MTNLIRPLLLAATIVWGSALAVTTLQPTSTIGFLVTTAVSMSPDGKTLAVGTRGATRIYETASWSEKVLTPKLSESANLIAWSKANRFATLHQGERVVIWDANTASPLAEIPTLPIYETGFVGNIAFSDNSQWLALYSQYIAAIQLFDWYVSPKPRLIKLPNGSNGRPPRSLLYLGFRGGQLLAISEDGDLFTIDRSGYTSIAKLPFGDEAVDVTFNSTFSQMVVSLNDAIRIWSFPDMRLLGNMPGKGNYYGVTTIADSQSILAANVHGNGVLWTLGSEKLTNFGDKSQSQYPKYRKYMPYTSADGNVVIFNPETHNLEVWNPQTNQLIRRLSSSGRIESIEVLSNGDIVQAAIFGQPNRQYRIDNGQEVGEVDRKDCSKLFAPVFSPNREYLAVTSGESQLRDNVKIGLADSRNCQIFAQIEAPRQNITSLNVSPDKRKAVLTFAEKATVWDLAGVRQLFAPTFTRRGENERARSGVFSPTSQELFIAYQTIIVEFDLYGQVRSQWDIPEVKPGYGSMITGLFISSDRRFITGALGSGDIFIWDYWTKEFLYWLKGHKEQVTGVVFLKDKLISGSSDGLIAVWQLR